MLLSVLLCIHHLFLILSLMLFHFSFFSDVNQVLQRTELAVSHLSEQVKRLSKGVLFFLHFCFLFIAGLYLYIVVIFVLVAVSPRCGISFLSFFDFFPFCMHNIFLILFLVLVVWFIQLPVPLLVLLLVCFPFWIRNLFPLARFFFLLLEFRFCLFSIVFSFRIHNIFVILLLVLVVWFIQVSVLLLLLLVCFSLFCPGCLCSLHFALFAQICLGC